MTITYHRDLIQGTDEWLEARRGHRRPLLLILIYDFLRVLS